MFLSSGGIMEKVIDAILNTTPFSAGVYGLLVFFLAYFLIKTRKDLAEEREYSNKINSEMLQLAKEFVSTAIKLEQAVQITGQKAANIDELILQQKEVIMRISALEQIIKEKVK